MSSLLITHQAGCWKLLLFSRRWHCRSCLWFLPCPQSLVCFSERTPCTRARSHFYTQGALRKLAAEWGGVRLALVALGFPMGPVRGSSTEVLPETCQLTSTEGPECSHPELHPFNAPYCSYLPFSQSPLSPQSWNSHLSTLDAAGEKWVSLAKYTTAGEAMHSLITLPFPCDRVQPVQFAFKEGQH